MAKILSLLFQTAVNTNDTDQWLSSFSIHQNHLEGLLRHRLLGPTTKVSDSLGQERGIRIKFLTSSQMMLMVLVQGPQFENHLYR